MAGPEGGNYDYPNPEIAEFESQQRQEELEALSGAEVSESVSGVVMSGEHEQGSVERQENVQKLLERFKGLVESGEIDGFDVFETFLLSADSEIQNLFLDRSNARNIKKVSEESGRFPVNEFEFQQSIIEGTILEQITVVDIETAEVDAETAEVDAETAEVDAETAEVDVEVTEKVIENISTLSSLKNNVNDSTVQRILSRLDNDLIYQIQNSDVSAISVLSNINDELKIYFSQPNVLETQILPQAQAEGPEVYAQVRESLINLGGGENGSGGEFEARILAFEMVPVPGVEAFPAEQQIRTSAALGTRVDEVNDEAEQTGNIFSLATYSGETIEYDVVTNERTLSRDGYRLESQIEDTGDYQTPKLEYMRVEQEHLPKITMIQTAIAAIEDKQIDVGDLAEIRATISSIPGIEDLGIDFMNMDSGDAIRAAFNAAFTYHSTEITEARDDYHDALIVLRDGHKAALEKKDRKTKKVLRFFESIGFTQIPQYITDQVVDTLNSNSSLRTQLGFNEIIDFENGQLGIDNNIGESEDLDLEDRKSFAEFVNKMLGVTDSDGNPPINVNAIGSSSPLTTEDGQEGKARFKMLIEESGIFIGGAGKAIENLSRIEQ